MRYKNTFSLRKAMNEKIKQKNQVNVYHSWLFKLNSPLGKLSKAENNIKAIRKC